MGARLASEMVKAAIIAVFFGVTISARGDLTIVQKIEGAGPSSDLVIKVKGQKARIDAAPQLTTIVDGKTGEMINLMKDQKKIVRISAEKMKAAAQMINKYDGNAKDAAAPKPKLVATGKKEKINGYDTEEYIYETPAYKATYWIAANYPDGPNILKQLQSLDPKLWAGNNMNAPDYHDFPGVPIKTVVSIESNQITTTLVSITQDTIDPSEFEPPKDFEEMKMPDIGNVFEDKEKARAQRSPP